MTRLTNFEPCSAAIRVAGMQSARPFCVPRSAFRSSSPSGFRPSPTSTSPSRDGSSTTTTSGSVTVSWRRIGFSSKRVYARIGAPRRSGPYSGKACTALPASSRPSAVSCAAVFAPWPARACQRISFIRCASRSSGRRPWRRGPPRRRSSRRSARRRRPSTSGCRCGRPRRRRSCRRRARGRRPRQRNSVRARWPIAFTTVSASTRNSEPSTASGRRRPLSSGSPRRISRHSTPWTRPSPRKRTGLARKRM